LRSARRRLLLIDQRLRLRRRQLDLRSSAVVAAIVVDDRAMRTVTVTSLAAAEGPDADDPTIAGGLGAIRSARSLPLSSDLNSASGRALGVLSADQQAPVSW